MADVTLIQHPFPVGAQVGYYTEPSVRKAAEEKTPADESAVEVGNGTVSADGTLTFTNPDNGFYYAAALVTKATETNYDVADIEFDTEAIVDSGDDELADLGAGGPFAAVATDVAVIADAPKNVQLPQDSGWRYVAFYQNAAS